MLLSKEVRDLARSLGLDREEGCRAAPAFEEEALDRHAVPAEERLHPREKAGSILRPDLERLAHRVPPQLFFFRGSETIIVSMDWPAGHIG